MLYELKNLKRVHGEQVILDIPRLDFQSGRITSLTGANGAGKTTLLNILAFLDNGYSGSINFCGRPIQEGRKHLFPLRRRVVLVDQYPLLFTGSLWKNIEFGLKVRKVPKQQRTKRVEQILELVGLQDFRRAEGRTLSGGETKRAALARALVVEPDVLLCDEPTANVDVVNQDILLGILERINQQENRSIIFSTHSLSQVQRLAHRTITLDAGRLTGLAGKNTFAAVVVGRENGRVTCEIGGRLLLMLADSKVPQGADRVRLLMNPEEIILVGERQRDSVSKSNQGRILSLCRKNDHVILVIDAGVRLTISMTCGQYRDKRYAVDDRVEFIVPDQAVTIDGANSSC